jgi:hypothetical protein
VPALPCLPDFVPVNIFTSHRRGRTHSITYLRYRLKYFT